MNLLNDLKLARRLKTGEVFAKERFYYLLIVSLLGQFLATFFIISITYRSVYNWWGIATDIVYLTSAFFGIIFIYHTNKRGDNKELIERFICISVPITIQLTLVFFLIHLIYFFFPLEKISYIFYYDVFGFMLGVLYNAYFYLRLNHSMKIASH